MAKNFQSREVKYQATDYYWLINVEPFSPFSVVVEHAPCLVLLFVFNIFTIYDIRRYYDDPVVIIII